MKTLTDLFGLILAETLLNEGKQVKYLFEISTQYMWVSMWADANVNGRKPEEIINMFHIEDEAQLQQAYWTIFNAGRSKNA